MQNRITPTDPASHKVPSPNHTSQDSQQSPKRLSTPTTILFDWHGTLVDTHEAMFSAMEEMLPMLEELQLIDRLIPETSGKTASDVKLIRYIRIFRRLHPKILAEGRTSRTEIFDAIFGEDQEAKKIAHDAYNQCYKHHYGKVRPIQAGVLELLSLLKQAGIQLGIATNRSREFLNHELNTVSEGRWLPLFSTTACADDITYYKPNPELLHHALKKIDQTVSPNIWYIGDSYLDVVTAIDANITPIFFNGGQWNQAYISEMFRPKNRYQPSAIINHFDELIDLVVNIEQQEPTSFTQPIEANRPSRFPPPEPPKQHIDPDWHPSVANLTPPKVILFDWHATLVDTLDAMYRAVDDMLPELKSNGLLDRLVTPEASKTPEDAKLVEYVHNYAQLHPKVKADRKISRTDIFEVLFGNDQEAKQIAHGIFTQHYRNHFGTVLPFEPQVRQLLIGLKSIGLVLGVITNRDREFFEHELKAVEGGGWSNLFETCICGDDTPLRKPHPDQLELAAKKLGYESALDVWYVGDSTTDIIASKRANMTGVFFNGAQWGLRWLHKIFPGTENHPHQPDVVVNDFSEFWALVLACLNK